MAALSIGEALQWGADRLVVAGLDGARLDARLLLAHALGKEQPYVMAYPEVLLESDQQQVFKDAINRRCDREPVSRIVGEREFWSLPFGISPHTLDPRPDSETLVEAVCDYLQERRLEAGMSGEDSFRLLDLGTGSGCLLLALLHENPDATGLGVDISPPALAQAQENAMRLGLDERADFLIGSWCDSLAGDWDVILSNPPYIPDADRSWMERDVLDYDPHSALFAGDEGLDCYRILVPQAFERLKRGGLLAVEIGRGQDSAVQRLMEQNGFELLEPVADLGGIVRVCRALRP
ncbi:peptide chain release factor N(5)-glutamine methyltransferase [Kiloniella sp. b19]|uniref:peptide chain release factor N(5)-glutamine methyltransferase n=1 Tax=Kiloniella sp. GXU_MW_B19 TaxID=3141326 RepID=UPI0031D41E3A